VPGIEGSVTGRGIRVDIRAAQLRTHADLFAGLRRLHPLHPMALLGLRPGLIWPKFG